MSYTIKYGNSYLYDPRYEEYYLTDVELEYEENSCGYLDFSIHPGHPLYDRIRANDHKNQVMVYDDENILFSGFIYEINEDFQLEHQVKCRGELDYLNETIVKPMSTYTRGFGSIVNPTYVDIFNWLINNHNSQADDPKRFEIGINQAFIFDDMYIPPSDIAIDDYPTVMDVISEIFIGSDGVGGYLRVRHENGKKYIDLLYEHTSPNTQLLEFGTNLTDYSKTNKSDDMISCVLATGARLKDTHYAYADGYYQKTESTPRSDVEYYTRDLEYIDLSNYVLTKTDFANQSNSTYWIYQKSYSDSGTASYTKTSHTYPHNNTEYFINYIGRYKYTSANITSFSSGVTYYKYDPNNDEGDTFLTIESLTDISEYSTKYIKDRDIIYSPEMLGKIGVKIAHVSNTSITTKEELCEAAIAYLDNNSNPKYSIEIKAIDLHIINPDIKPLNIGEFVRVRSKPHNVDQFFICRNITLDLNDPSQSTYVLGLTYDTLTSDQAKRLALLERLTNKQIDATTKLTEAEKRRSNSDIRNLSSISQEQDAAITSLFEMIIGS